MAFREHYKRSIIKAITYRFVILISDGFIIFLITHRYDTTAKVIVFSNIASTLLYFFHERFWKYNNFCRSIVAVGNKKNNKSVGNKNYETVGNCFDNRALVVFSEGHGCKVSNL
jgi:uncharacterized membrane protein